MNPIPRYFTKPISLVASAVSESRRATICLEVRSAGPELEINAPIRPLVLGFIEAEQRGVVGPLTLDVLMDIRGEWLEIGAFRFPSERPSACFACCWSRKRS
ncbi:MAG: hypothetical protein IPL51_09025 [Candidatus Competibacteraceae bacterium]|nr:hypothetical protein [Candidatus Competibacteraceae bacterium]